MADELATLKEAAFNELIESLKISVGCRIQMIAKELVRLNPVIDKKSYENSDIKELIYLKLKLISELSKFDSGLKSIKNIKNIDNSETPVYPENELSVYEQGALNKVDWKKLLDDEEDDEDDDDENDEDDDEENDDDENVEDENDEEEEDDDDENDDDEVGEEDEEETEDGEKEKQAEIDFFENASELDSKYAHSKELRSELSPKRPQKRG
jgi:hypothetical protein